jgi:hypothetical protein
MDTTTVERSRLDKLDMNIVTRAARSSNHSSNPDQSRRGCAMMVALKLLLVDF